MIAKLMITGCASSTKQYERPPLPVNLAAPCPPIEELNSNSWDELAKAYIKLVFDYSDCAAKHEAVVGLW